MDQKYLYFSVTDATSPVSMVLDNRKAEAPLGKGDDSL